MTTQIPTQPSTSAPAGGPDAPGGTPYPDIADTLHATAAAAAFFRSFFTAKTSKDIEATHAHFHPGKTVYFDATLGWALPTNADVRKMWEQYMPQWPAGAKSYPTRILGDMTSAVVFTTDTPELFGGEIRTITIADLEDGKIVRVVDYWDGRAFGAEARRLAARAGRFLPARTRRQHGDQPPGADRDSGRGSSRPRSRPATPTALASCSATTRSLRTWRCGRSSAAGRPSCATCGAPCPVCPTPGHRSGTWPALARAADTNGAQTAS